MEPVNQDDSQKSPATVPESFYRVPFSWGACMWVDQSVEPENERNIEKTHGVEKKAGETQ